MDWWARVPENGAGAVVVAQFQTPPPEPLAPAGRASSNHAVSVTTGAGGSVGAAGLLTVMETLAETRLLPALS